MSETLGGKFQDIKINTHVSYFLHFKDEKLGIEYGQWKVAQTNTYAFVPLHLCCCFYFVFGTYNGLLRSLDWFNVMNFIACMFFIVGVGTFLVLVHFKGYFFQNKENVLNALTPSFTADLESYWLMGCSFCLSLVLFALAHNGECSASEGSIQMAKSCNYSGDPSMLPMDLVMTLFFGPIIHAIVLKGATFFSVIVALSMNATSLFTTMYFYRMSFGGPLILLFCPMCVLVLYEFQRQGIVVFLMSQSQALLLEEIDRLSIQTSKELRSMIGNVAHDLKTPMSAFVSGLDFISSMLEEIQNRLDERSEVLKNLKSINESVVNMKNINSFMRMSINRCIDYTKASSGMVLVPHMETVNFREMLNLPLSCMKNLQDGKVKIELMPIPSEIASFIITDPQWFQENVLCLLSNAVKYSVEGMVSLSVSVVHPSIYRTLSTDSQCSVSSVNSQADSYLRIDVNDTGIGVSDDLKPHLFTPFKQAQRLAGGTGLGLYSLAKRIEAMGGKFGVKNREDGLQGSDFWFSIPYRPDESYMASTMEEKALVPEEKPKALNILLVDDSISILKMTGKMLTRLGHTVTTAENGAIAVKTVCSTFMHEAQASSKVWKFDELKPKFDVVLMDLQMPIMDGLEATKRLRVLEQEHEAGGNEPIHQIIVGVSANSDDETIQVAMNAGVDDFIPKPFNAKTFEDLYRQLSIKFKLSSRDSSQKHSQSTTPK